jgi:hypothetical protein
LEWHRAAAEGNEAPDVIAGEQVLYGTRADDARGSDHGHGIHLAGLSSLR